MKPLIKFLVAASFMLFLSSYEVYDDNPKNNLPAPLIYRVNSALMNGNNISAWYRNNGSFNRDPVTGNTGFEWPKGSAKFARYASGLWIGAKVGNDTLIAIAEYDYEYLPGFIDNLGNPQGKDDSLYRIYSIEPDNTLSADYRNWPFYQGAYRDSAGKPHIIGNRTMFFSMTDGYPEAHGNNAGTTMPLKAQILVTNWSYGIDITPLGNVVFTEYRIINKGNLPWERCYFAIWSDDDLGDANDDAVGCDTVLGLGFTYNFDNNDPVYGTSPPAVGFQFLRGPMVDSPLDTARYFSPPGSSNLIKKPGRRFLGMTSFNTYTGGNPSVGDPSNYRETYYNLQGIRRNGSVWVNPVNGQPTTFAYSGDPYTGSGWNETNNGDRRILQSSGPCIVNPGDTQSIVVAQLISRYGSNKQSVTLLKNLAGYVNRFFTSNLSAGFAATPPVISSYSSGNGKIVLSWNDSCERISYPNQMSGGTYKFQGYNIYRIRPNNVSPSNADTILIKTFDIIDGVKDIRDSIYLNEYQGIIYGVVQKGTDNGISRFIELSRDTVSGLPFTTGSSFKFSVTAYYYDPLGGIHAFPKLLSSGISVNIVTVVPQAASPDATVSYGYGDTVRTNQNDKAVLPLIFQPYKLVNADYTSVFGGTFQAPLWTLLRNSGNRIDTLFRDVGDFKGMQDTAKIADGLMFLHKLQRDSGIIKDVSVNDSYKGWTYRPEQNLWFEGPETNAVKIAKIFRNRQFESRSTGMSFPTLATFINRASSIKANGSVFHPFSNQNQILSGGPLRKIQIVFGQNSKSYRFVPADTSLISAPCADYADVPFSVYAVDMLDSGGGTPRQLNTGFLDIDNDGIWKPDTSALGNYLITYIFASDYDPSRQPAYLAKNPLAGNPGWGFPSMDAMYVWLPRARKKPDGTPQTFVAGDIFTVTPLRITRPDFVPGYPVKYSWEISGTTVSASRVTSAEVSAIGVFPNPYYATSELEYDSGGDKFIYFSNVPMQANIFIYTLDGVPVKRIERNSADPGSSLQKWDLRNSDGSFAASGVYIVFVDCGSAGSKILKLAVFSAR